MNRREEWNRVLDTEVERWSALSWEQLLSEVPALDCYEVEFDSKKYQVEIEILENTEHYLNVAVSVDDGSLPQSVLPATRSFIRRKTVVE